jgi:hypothetical protein
MVRLQRLVFGLKDFRYALGLRGEGFIDAGGQTMCYYDPDAGPEQRQTSQ